MAREVRRRHHPGHRRRARPVSRAPRCTHRPAPGAVLMLRPIVRYPAPDLNAPAAPVTAFDAELDRLIDDMVDTMYAAPGIGLAAPQIGVPLRVCVIDLSVGRRGGELHVLVN